MKIVLLIDYFQPKLGYQEYFVAREMKKLGHDVCVVTSNYYFPFPEYAKTVQKVLGPRKVQIGTAIEEGVLVHRLPLLFETSNGAVTLLSGLSKKLKEIKPDIVFSDGVFTPLALQSGYLKNKIGYKLFYDNHASNFNTNLWNSLPKKLYMFFFSTIIIPYIKSKSDGFSAVGLSEKHLIEKEYKLTDEEVHLFPLGADTNSFFPDHAVRQRLRKQLKFQETDKVIIYSGKITPNKDVIILFQALNSILKTRRDVKLLIVGDGVDGTIKQLKDYAEHEHIDNNITWVGMVENSLLPQYLNAADIGIWPGNYSNLILEALAIGLCLILPEKVLPDHDSKFLVENDNGFLFKRGNPEDLKDKIKLLVENDNLRIEMSKKSRELSLKKFSWQEITKNILNYFNNP